MTPEEWRTLRRNISKAEMESERMLYELNRLILLASAVCELDWSSNDADAVQRIDRLKDALRETKGTP